MVGRLVERGVVGMRLWVQIPLPPPLLFDFPLLLKKSNSCNPISTIDDTKKVYLIIRVLEDSQACKACWASVLVWEYELG